MTLDLSRPRELGALFGDSLRLYFGNFWRFLAIGAVVMVPAELIVSGIGLQEFGAGFDTKQSAAAQALPLVVQALVTTPLTVAMTVYLLQDIAGGRGASLRRAIQSGLDAFRPLFLPVLATIAGEALVTFAVVLPLVALGSAALTIVLIIPLILAVRWYFVPQTVLVDGARGLDALRASWELTRGFSWRVFGVVILGYLAFGTAAAIVGAPISAVAKSADSGALLVLYQAVRETLAAPALALLGVLLYFDVKARRA